MKLIRAGHKPSITQIIAQALESSWNQPSGTRRNCMKKHLQLLKGKLEIIEKLDAQILESLETEDEITGEIEKADILKESIAMTMIDLETALREQKNDAPSQSRTAQDRTDEPRQENGARPGTPDSRDTREVLGGTVSRSHCRTYSVYEKAITVLKKRFGNKQQLINKHVEALLSLLAVTSVYEFRNLRQLYDKVESHVRSLKSIGVAASSCGNLLASILMKIPSDLCLIVSRETVEDNWDLDSLLKILGKEIEARERLR
ncbi:hypothetical protein EMCRGX_G010329 [Ephydatia muelleri]